MKLRDVIGRIHQARAHHKAWVAHAEALVMGVPLDREKAPVLPTDCAFGQWYYGEGQMLRRIEAFRRIEDVHDELHKTYMEIVALLFNEPDVSLIGRLMGESRKIKEENHAQAERMIELLRHLSDELDAALDTLEKQIMARAKRPSPTEG